MSEPKEWIVRIRCTVTKDVFTQKCTREEAEQNPWDFAVNEEETDVEDWETLSVKENA